MSVAVGRIKILRALSTRYDIPISNKLLLIV